MEETVATLVAGRDVNSVSGLRFVKSEVGRLDDAEEDLTCFLFLGGGALLPPSDDVMRIPPPPPPLLAAPPIMGEG